MKLKQKGFAGLHLLIVAVALLVVASSGYLVWHSHHKPNVNTANFTWRQ